MSAQLTQETTPETLLCTEVQAAVGLRVLYILGPLSPRDWLSQAFDEEGVDQIHVTVTPSFTTGLEQLRQQAFDVVLLDQDASDRPAAELIAAIQAGTRPDQAVVVLAEGDERSRAAGFLLAGASAYLSLRSSTTQELVCQLDRAAQLSRLQAENRRLSSWQQRHGERDQGEALSYLQEQAQIVARFILPAAATDLDEMSSPGTCRIHRTEAGAICRDLLQAYVVMGGGGLSDEVRRVVSRWHADSQTLVTLLAELNRALGSLVQERGGRSARHVLNRGNLLLVELLLNWNQLAGGRR